MAAYSAILRGASSVYVVDRVPERLEKAREMGAIPIDFSKSDAVEQIEKHNGGLVDRAVDAVGYQAVGSTGDKEEPNIVLSNLIKVVRPTGGLGIPGLYVPSDPGAPDKQSAEGIISLPFGKLFEKGLSLGTGQCNVKSYNRQLRDLIISGRAKPSFVVSSTVKGGNIVLTVLDIQVSHHVGLEDAPAAYQKFDAKEDGYTKVRGYHQYTLVQTGLFPQPSFTLRFRNIR